jgi:hypothetical protein
MFDPMETNRPTGAALGNAADYRLASSASNEERRRNFVLFLTLLCRMNPSSIIKGDASMARLAYTSILIALVATCATAQAQQPGGGSAAQIMSSIPANSVTITNWYKQSVYDPNDSKIGEIMDVLVDREGKVTTLIVGVGGFLGMGENVAAAAFPMRPRKCARLVHDR